MAPLQDVDGIDAPWERRMGRARADTIRLDNPSEKIAEIVGPPPAAEPVSPWPTARSRAVTVELPRDIVNVLGTEAS